MNTRKTKFILLIIILTVVLTIGATIVINNSAIEEVIKYRLAIGTTGLESTTTTTSWDWSEASISPGCSGWITDPNTKIKFYVPKSWNATNVEVWYKWGDTDLIQMQNYYYSLQDNIGYYEISVPEEERFLGVMYSEAYA